ncbi:MAG: lamin tail domain-containing protein [Phycisphaerales bacterium]|nr:lamin tail domain-containing protein [Phycisphaerales bacterium]
MKTAWIMALAGVAGIANADVLISEVLGSTSSSDWEFIEIVNTGPAAVSLDGYSVELWDSDEGNVGGGDGAAPYFISGGVTLNPGQVYTLGNSLAATGYAITFDGDLPSNAIENSSYTIILADNGGVVSDAILVVDGDVDDLDNANRAGAPIVPSMTAGPDGTFLPAGFARTDLSGGHVILNFDTADLNNGTLEGGTPGVNQIPAPAGLAVLGLGALAARRRR